MRALALLIALLAAVPAPAQNQYPYDETITVVRYLLEVRVSDFGGKAIEDLKAEEFTVTIDGKPAHVESASWIAGGAPLPVPPSQEEPEAETAPAPDAPAPEPAGRSVVFFVQTDFGRAIERVKGQLKFNSVASWFIEKLDPHDRVAVLSHDSRLKLRLDFTDDRKAVRDAVIRSIRIDRPPLPAPATSGPSLVRLLDPDAMAHAENGEQALLLVARAMHAIEGRKVVILAGWGLGEKYGRFVLFPPEWYEAVRMLESDRTPVMVLNTGAGGELTIGLKATAQATGGAHIWTQAFVHQSVERFGGALAGSYELALQTDEPLAPGAHKLAVKVARKGAIVAAPDAVFSR